VALVQERYEDAEKAFRRAFELAPEEPSYHYNLGLTLQNIDRNSEAENEFRKALDLKEDYYPAYNGLGDLLFDQEYYDKAKAEFEKALTINPNDADTHNFIGNVARVQQRYEDAEQAFHQAIKINENDPYAYLNLGSLLTSLERYDEAETCLNKAVELNIKDDENHNELGLCYYKQNKYVEAVLQYRHAVLLNLKNVTAQQGLALSLMALERFYEAESQLRPLVESKANLMFDPEDAWIIHETLADLYARLGDKIGDELYYDEAVQEVDKALSGVPNNNKAALYFKRGIINYYLKKYEIAERDFQHCVNSNNEHWAAKRNLERLQTSLSSLRLKTLERISKFFCVIGFIQLIGLWILYIIGFSQGKTYISPTTFAILAPLFFALSLVSILLPQLTKLKVGGIEADIEKSTLIPLERVKGLKLETSGKLIPSSNIMTKKFGIETEKGKKARNP